MYTLEKTKHNHDMYDTSFLFFLNSSLNSQYVFTEQTSKRSDNKETEPASLLHVFDYCFRLLSRIYLERKICKFILTIISCSIEKSTKKKTVFENQPVDNFLVSFKFITTFPNTSKTYKKSSCGIYMAMDQLTSFHYSCF